MTHEQLEEYLTALLPTFIKQSKRFTNTHDDNTTHEDICQLTIINLWKTLDKIHAKTEKEFIKLFWSYYHTLHQQQSWEIQQAIKRGDTLHNGSSLPCTYTLESDPFYEGAEQTLSQCKPLITCDPWNSQRIEALEFIELVDNPKWKEIVRLYYIEGYTMQELAEQYNVSPERIRQIIEKAVKGIKKAYHSIVNP